MKCTELLFESYRDQFDGLKTYTVRFDGGKYEEWSYEVLACSNDESIISIGDVEFIFIRKLVGAVYINGEVTEKRECTFCGGEVSSYTLARLTNYALTQQPTVIEYQ